ncbi:MAG: DUF1028 domain-containing protein [Desulfurococcales archaeon]|jgi:uncharacterized Ntn-hydrolase superfamily protein|nr:DUF1028 domain-containing protein [Desulfurococcales archaeon]
MTYTIIGFDPLTGDLGIAVASKFLAVGAVVPHAKAGVGAIATQAYANYMFGPRGLDLLAKGMDPGTVVEELLRDDPYREARQVGIIDAKGRAAAFTGKNCIDWKGHKFGRNVVVLGNILKGEEVLDSMLNAFEETEGELVDKLLAALQAGDRAGGDRRGKQSAAILVVRESGGFMGYGDRYVDLRVDDHPEPVIELVRIFRLYDSTRLLRPGSRDIVALPARDVRELQSYLKSLGYYRGEPDGYISSEFAQALTKYLLDKGISSIPYIDSETIKKILLKSKGTSKIV